MSSLTPRQIVQELDKHIIGQDAAKRAVAIALRNRWRRMQVQRAAAPGDHAQEHPHDRSDRRRQDRDRAAPGEARQRAVRQGRGHQVHRGRLRRPRRRLDRQGAGRRRRQDDARAGDGQGARARARCRRGARARCAAAQAAHDGLLDRRAGARRATARRGRSSARCCASTSSTTARSRSSCAPCRPGVEIMAPPGMEEMQQQLQSMFQNLGGNRTRTRKVKVREALKLLIDEEAGKLINEDELKIQALANAEQNGIVFIDEIDKVDAPPGDHRRGRLARGRAARPAAAGRGLDGGDQVRAGEDRPRAVHRLRRLQHVQALGPDPRAAGPAADPRRARLAQGRGLRAHPHRAGRLAHRAVPGADGDRGGARWSSPRTACGASPRSPSTSTSAPRTSARGACTPSWSACSRPSPTRPREQTANGAGQGDRRRQVRRRSPRASWSRTRT